MKRHFRYLLLFLVFSPSLFAKEVSCPTKAGFFQKLKITQLWSSSRQVCQIMVVAKDPGSDYRSYTFDSMGGLLVFVNIKNRQTGKNSDGAQKYMFFPNSGDFSYQLDEVHHLLRINLPSGHQFVFNAISGDLSIEESSGEIIYDPYLRPQIDPKGKGGLKIHSLNFGFYLDLGFGLRELAFKNRNNKSVFKDSLDNTCVVPNEEIGIYADGDVTFRYRNHRDLENFLRDRCNNLLW